MFGHCKLAYLYTAVRIPSTVHLEQLPVAMCEVDESDRLLGVLREVGTRDSVQSYSKNYCISAKGLPRKVQQTSSAASCGDISQSICDGSHIEAGD